MDMAIVDTQYLMDLCLAINYLGAVFLGAVIPNILWGFSIN